jgi:acyl-[acyl carrier protein]--UDP-N-acetylglucosamine O-acyltransferase
MFELSKTVRLSDFPSHFTEIRRDVEFFAIGKIPTRLVGRVVPLAKPQYASELLNHGNDIVGVIATEECAHLVPETMGCAISEKPISSANTIHAELTESGGFWQDFPSVIHETASIHPRAYVSDKNVMIGAGTIVDANASIMDRTIIGERCYIGPGSVIGSLAYEVGEINGVKRVMPQAGGVSIGNEVVFLANVTVARSIFPLFTRIGDYSSFDNLVHVAHDCYLGNHVKMMAGAILCGRVTIEDEASIAPNATVANGVHVGAKSYVTLGAVVVKNVKGEEKVSGNFAFPHKDFVRQAATLARLAKVKAN